jgi:PAS domain S-box-containing protein
MRILCITPKSDRSDLAHRLTSCLSAADHCDFEPSCQSAVRRFAASVAYDLVLAVHSDGCIASLAAALRRSAIPATGPGEPAAPPAWLVAVTDGSKEAVQAARQAGADETVTLETLRCEALPRTLEGMIRRSRTGHRRTEARMEQEIAALRASEERYRRLVENAPDVIYRFRLTLPVGFDYINQTVFAMTGYTPEEHYQDPQMLIRMVHPSDRGYLRQALEQPENLSSEVPPIRWIRKDGRAIWVQQRITLQRDPSGRPIALEAMVREVTQQIEAEHHVRRSEQRMQALLEAIPDLIFVLSREGEYIEVISKDEAALAFQPEDIIGRNIREAGFTNYYLTMYFDAIQRTLNDGQAQTFEYKLQVPKGERAWEARMVPLQQDQVLVMVRDITGQRTAEAQLNLQADMLKAAANAIVITDQRGIIEWVNHAFEKLTGYTAAEAIGQPTNMLRSGQQDPGFYRQLWETITAGEFWQGELINRRKDGTLYVEEQTITPVRGEDGQIAHFIAVKQDVSERKQREQELLAMIQVASAMRETAGRLDTAARALEIMQAAVGAAGAALLSSDLTGDAFRVEHARGNWAVLNGQRLPFAMPPAFPSSVENIAPGLLPPALRLQGTFAYTAFPLVSQNQTVGIVCLNRRTPLEDKDLRLLSALADIAASSIQRATLFEQTERHLRRVQALHAVETAISASPDLRPTLNIFLSHLIAQLHVDAAAVLLLNDKTRTLEYGAGQGFLTNDIANVRVALGKGFAGQVALQGKIITLERANMGATRAFAQNISAEGFQTYIGVPLIARGQVRGVLELYHRSPLKTTPDWVTFMNTLAEQAAIAIDKAALFEGLQASKQELEAAYESTLAGWARALELRDHETEGHSRRVTELTLRLANLLGIEGEDLAHVRRGTLLHDIGKMGIPDQILLKPGPLTEEEWAIMRLHPTFARDMLAPIEFLRPALDIPYMHHEHWDGKGYPQGLRGEGIPLAARIFAVVDVWDALRSDRPYRSAWAEDRIIRYLRANSGAQFDPKVVEAFLKIIETPGRMGPNSRFPDTRQARDDHSQRQQHA